MRFVGLANEERGWAYEERDGMCIPMEGEVAWQLPEERWPYA